MEVARSVVLFGLAGVAEIAGGYLLWQWLREDRPLLVGLLGSAIIILYGIIPTLQPVALDFGRVLRPTEGRSLCCRCCGDGWLTEYVRINRASGAQPYH